MTVALRVCGGVPAPESAEWRALFRRETSADDAVREATARIVRRVQSEGDAALRALALEFDGVMLDALEVPRAAWRAALDSLAGPVRRALERSAGNVRAVHEAFRPVATEFTTADGVTIGRRPDPLHRVGVYAPGGSAAYPSSLFMGAVPARVAGVREVIVCSPPQRGAGGLPSPLVLAAAEIAEVDRLFALGGAGAIAAMAFGTASVPRVDRIVGPGNAYVAEAKLQVVGAVAIDAPAGPSELLVVADEFADPASIAWEMVAQAEHDANAAVVLVTASETLAASVWSSLQSIVPGIPRESIVRRALAARGAVVTTATLDDAVAFASEYAAEHVLVSCVDSDRLLSRLRSSGTIFVGSAGSVAFGDYMTGANHVLPTGGLARSYSGLSTSDFVRWTTWQRIDRSAAASLADDTATFADAEGLPAHAEAARRWSRERR